MGEEFKGRREDQRLITGQGRYTADWNFPNQVFGHFLRSDRPHAEIARLDTSEAARAPGHHRSERRRTTPPEGGHAERAVLICGSGAGACVAANKFHGIRAATCHDSFSGHQCVEDDDCNVLCLGARVIGPELAAEVVRDYMSAKFSGAERHKRRVAKVASFEK